MCCSVGQGAVGIGNLQVGRDLHQISIVNVVSGHDFPTDIDRAIEQTISGLENLQSRLGHHDALFNLWFYLIIIITLTAIFSALSNAWLLLFFCFAIISILGLQLQKHSRVISLLRIDRDAHKEVLSALCRKKVFSNIGGSDAVVGSLAASG